MTHDRDVAALRREYGFSTLLEEHLDGDPMRQFKVWFDEAMREEAYEPNACTFASVSSDMQPAARTVLLKSIDDRGLVFFTNYESRKGREVAVNPRGAMLFFWPKLERQVRIEGHVEKTSEQESDVYFASRPRNAQIAASISQQSQSLGSRADLESAYEELSTRIGEGAIRRPPHWGGLRLVPSTFEFWQGRESRLHDRFHYFKEGALWKIERLWP